MIRDAILSITFIDGPKCPPNEKEVLLLILRSLAEREKLLLRIRFDSLLRVAPTETVSGRFPEQDGARLVWPGQVSGPDRVRALRAC